MKSKIKFIERRKPHEIGARISRKNGLRVGNVRFQVKFEISKCFVCIVRRTAASYVGIGPTSLLGYLRWSPLRWSNWRDIACNHSTISLGPKSFPTLRMVHGSLRGKVK